MRNEYLFLFGKFTPLGPDQVDALTLNDFAIYIDGIDAWMALLPKLAAAGQIGA